MSPQTPMGFLAQEGGTFEIFEFEILQYLDDLEQMSQAGGSLSRARERDGAAHFVGNGFGHGFRLGFVDVDNPAQQGQARLDGGLGVGFESTLGRGHGSVDIGRGSERDGGDGPFRGGVDNFEVVGFGGIDPFSIDIKLAAILHVSPRRRFEVSGTVVTFYVTASCIGAS